MTTVTSHPGSAAGTRRRLPRLVSHESGADLRCFCRNTQGVFFTLILPVLFLVIFASIFRNSTVSVPGVFPVQHLAAALLAAYNPHTAGSGFRRGGLAVLAAWGAAGLIIAVRRFDWLPRGG